MLLYLLQFLLLLVAQFEPAALHQNELGEELGLLQQEIEFLAALHFWRGRGALLGRFTRRGLLAILVLGGRVGEHLR